MFFCHKIHHIFMIYSLLFAIFVFVIYALFYQIFQIWLWSSELVACLFCSGLPLPVSVTYSELSKHSEQPKLNCKSYCIYTFVFCGGALLAGFATSCGFFSSLTMFLSCSAHTSRLLHKVTHGRSHIYGRLFGILFTLFVSHKFFSAEIFKQCKYKNSWLIVFLFFLLCQLLHFLLSPFSAICQFLSGCFYWGAICMCIFPSYILVSSPF